MDYIDYREKLGIGFNDEEKGEFFIIRFMDYISHCTTIPFSRENEIEFCYKLCISVKAESLYDEQTIQRLAQYFRKKKTNFLDFLACSVILANIYRSFSGDTILQDVVEQILKDSHIRYDLLKEGNDAFIFPKGAKELDRALVSEPLEWLKCYPKSHEVFIKTLKLYASVSPNTASDVADGFRKSLETFFKEFFHTSKSLENCKSEYGVFLQKHGVPSEVSNNFENLLQQYYK